MKTGDYFTSTVDGAAGYERMRVGNHKEIPDDYYEKDNCADEENEEEDREPECNCSDPGCPCGGIKYGRL
jgi:hypothetical protein